MKQNLSAYRIWLEINLDVLEENVNKIQQYVQPLQVLAVLKANAYGLGAEKIAERLCRHTKISGFCVADLKEALSLLPFGKPVQILGAVMDSEIPEAVDHGIILGITDFETAVKFSKEAVRQNKIQECHFKLDTGMGRLGILPDQAVDLILQCRKLPNLNCCGIYSHFAMIDGDEGQKRQEQILFFKQILEKCKEQGIYFKKIHMANSDAVNGFPDVVQQPFNHVRAGIDLHGAFTGKEKNRIGLKPVFSLKSRIVSIRKLPAGHTVGYNCTCQLQKETLVGVVAAGYADGLPLSLSNTGKMLVHGKICPVLGRISMDYTTVSLEAFQEKEVQIGDEVICLGRDGDCEIPVEDWATIKGTHPYDILCSFGNRVQRIYI